jgi:hypothetical protein
MSEQRSVYWTLLTHLHFDRLPCLSLLALGGQLVELEHTPSHQLTLILQPIPAGARVEACTSAVQQVTLLCCVQFGKMNSGKGTAVHV